MPSMTVTITDKTKAAANLYQLAFGTAPAGYSVVKNDVPGNIGGNPTGPAQVEFLQIQASYGNAAAKVYRGGSATANDGTNQARELLAGDLDIFQKGTYPTIHLASIYIRTDTNNSVINVEWQA